MSFPVVSDVIPNSESVMSRAVVSVNSESMMSFPIVSQ